ncbi:hypothetical protein ACFV23_43200 [Streptomyces sp. NPDC059627]
MTGRRKSTDRQRRRNRRAPALRAPEAGRWETVFETQDESEWRALLHRLRNSEERIDWTNARLDVLCGRLERPTTYRLSVFVPTGSTS